MTLVFVVVEPLPGYKILILGTAVQFELRLLASVGGNSQIFGSTNVSGFGAAMTS